MRRLLSRETLTLPDGSTVPASAPLIISASRATDIPAFHMPWMMNRISNGFAARINPYSGKPHFVSFSRCKGIVFWSKNPALLIEHFPGIIARFPGSYLQFTLNDYDRERLEPGVPPLTDRLKTLELLARIIGRERIIWRFDPILVADTLSLDAVLDRLELLAKKIIPLSAGLVFSFLDFDRYTTVRSRLRRSADIFSGPPERYRITAEMKKHAVERIATIAESGRLSNPGFTAATCADAQDYSAFGIGHSACIDIRRISGLAGMKDLFGNAEQIEHRKDPGQRPECSCDLSRDIGTYGTCPHQCIYCYANGMSAITGSGPDPTGWALGNSKNT